MRKGDVFGGWELVEPIGEGGNGEVWRVSRGTEVGAIKFLKKLSRVGRFKDEIEAMTRLGDVEGVIPILESHLPSDANDAEGPWFVMPLATPLVRALANGRSLQDVVSAVRDIANVLVEVHRRGMAHRDIKPQNLFWFRDRWSIGDLGLASYEGKESRTLPEERIGPLNYLAPEMVNAGRVEDFRPADVFSIAKTLWVLATGQRFPLPGAYDANSSLCALSGFVSSGRTNALDKLIERCSRFDPGRRPSMKEFSSELSAWIEGANDKTLSPFDLKLSAEWAEIVDAAAKAKSDRDRSDQLHGVMEQAIKNSYSRLSPVFMAVSDNLREIGFDEISCPPHSEGRSSGWLPAKVPPEPQVGLELGLWLVPVHEDENRERVIATFIVRLNYRASPQINEEELYRAEFRYVIQSPSEETLTAWVEGAIREGIVEWLNAARTKRDLLS